jgi:hypothetical protein
MRMSIGHYGKKGGTPFKEQYVHTIGMSANGSRMTQLRLNGVSFGAGEGSVCSDDIVLDRDEYIKKVVIRDGSDVDAIEFTTNTGKKIGGGGSGGGETVLDNVRVVAIGGSAGSLIDCLSIRYIQDFKPSEVVQRNIKVVLGYVAPNTTLKGFKSEESKMLDAYARAMSAKSSYKYSASVEAEYFVKASASTNIEFENSSEESIKKELEKQSKAGDEYESTIDAGHVGLILASGVLMKYTDKEQTDYWIEPTASNYAMIRFEDAVTALRGHYDLTGTLSTQISSLRVHETVQHGLSYFKETE